MRSRREPSDARHRARAAARLEELVPTFRQCRRIGTCDHDRLEPQSHGHHLPPCPSRYAGAYGPALMALSTQGSSLIVAAGCGSASGRWCHDCAPRALRLLRLMDLDAIRNWQPGVTATRPIEARGWVECRVCEAADGHASHSLIGQ